MENWLEIDLNKLKSNYEYIKKISGSNLCPVVKANAYGLGSIRIAKELVELGANIFAVAFLDEAILLRKNGIEKDILVFNYVDLEELSEKYDGKIILTLFSLEQLKNILNINIASKIRFHIKINTGMNRLGFDEKDINELCYLIEKYDLKVEGIYSHFSDVEDENFTRKQYMEFIRISEIIEEKLSKKFVKHISNSAGALKYKEFNLDFIRCGMGLYGLQPLKVKNENISNVLSWKSKISDLRNLSKGERISYGNEEIEEDKKIAIVPIGYSHGYIFQNSKNGYVIINGLKANILGNIFMDQMIVDVTEIDGISIGQEVVVLGDGVEAEEIAKFSNTIADDVISKISLRVKRIYK